MVVPIRKLIRNKRLLSLLEFQYASGTELGVELVESAQIVDGATIKNMYRDSYRVYTRRDSNNWSRDRFIIERIRRSGKIREYRLEGVIYINQ